MLLIQETGVIHVASILCDLYIGIPVGRYDSYNKPIEVVKQTVVESTTPKMKTSEKVPQPCDQGPRGAGAVHTNQENSYVKPSPIAIPHKLM